MLNYRQRVRKRKEDIHGKTNSKKGRFAKKKKCLVFLIFCFIPCPLVFGVQSCQSDARGEEVLSRSGGNCFTSFSPFLRA